MAAKDTYHRLKVFGLVQGVGFRPFVLEFCKSRGIKGLVKNTGSSACIYVYGDEKTTGALIRRLSCIKGSDSDIPGARVDAVETEEISREEFESEVDADREFYIEKSGSGSERIRFIPPDAGICEDCLRELKDPSDRRYRHPFISCVSCGPRFSIMEDVPYDREKTSMKDFPLCSECAKEYITSGKRQHAQTIACNKCGPKLKAFIMGDDGRPVLSSIGEDALQITLGYIREGRTAAVKNTGGYHFVFDATAEGASEKLRSFKNRQTKPFAVMFSDIDDIRKYCAVSKKEEELLRSSERPIVLVKKNSGKTLAKGVCDDSLRIGAMLPCDGIQALLLEDGVPLVMTSANRRGQPLAFEDEEALSFLRDGACDIVLANDRKIINPLDDSIYQVIETEGRTVIQTLRRARGMVPGPVTVKEKVREDAFAAGGDLKASFAYARDDRVFFGGHFGDLSDERACENRRCAVKTLGRMLEQKPRLYAADLHPGYFSAGEIRDRRPEGVLHHRAHLLSVAAEHGLSGKLVGASFDGTGYGDDGTVWGGEFLVLDPGSRNGYRRAGHLKAVRLTGGDSIAYDAEKAAMCFAFEAVTRGLISREEDPFDGEKYDIVKKALRNNINVHLSSSAGRFFDACAAVLGICSENTYEGECPERLQAKAEEISDSGSAGSRTGLKASIIREDDMYVADTVSLFSDIVRLKNEGMDTSLAAYEIHLAAADIIVRCILMAAEEAGTDKVLLGGGTFANSLLVKMVLPALEKKGFEVYMNEKVPPGDGGLALGQILALT